MNAKRWSIDILWEDRAALVVNKPAGLSTQAPPGIESLEMLLAEEFRDPPRRGTDSPLHDADAAHAILTPDLPNEQLRKEGPRKVLEPSKLAVAHRLDRPVSGALLVARTVAAARRLGAQFETRKIAKSYLALVSPPPPSSAETLEDFLRKVPGQPLATVVPADHPEGQWARLHYRQLLAGTTRGGDPWGLLDIELETGRMHQIRVQLGSRGFPVVGDSTYGSKVLLQARRDDDPCLVEEKPEADSHPLRIALHSRSLTFHHPTTGVRTKVVAPLPPEWLQWAPDALIGFGGTP